MTLRDEITTMVQALEWKDAAPVLRLRAEDVTRLEGILQSHPDLWPVGVADTLSLLRQKLRWEPVDRSAVPDPLVDLFDDLFRRDLDPLAMARQMGQELHACQDCGCRC